ncbi:MAG: cytochrome c, partial [Betaproteobacteria bacterium]
MTPLRSRGAESTAPGTTTDIIKKGEYLARAGDCVACHTIPGGKQFAGRRAMPTPFGNLY